MVPPLVVRRARCDDVRMRLILVRHGQTPANVAGSLDTTLPGPELTGLGTRQAQALVGDLAEQPIDAVFASEATRAQLTAAPIAGARELPVQVLPGTFEIQAGALEKRTDWPSIQIYIDTLRLWREGDLSAAAPDGENGHEMLRRMDAAIAHLHSSGLAAVVLVSHGAVIRAWAGMRCSDAADLATRPLDNTGVVILDGDPTVGWGFVSWTETCAGGLEDEQPDDAEHDPTGAG